MKYSLYQSLTHTCTHPDIVTTNVKTHSEYEKHPTNELTSLSSWKGGGYEQLVKNNVLKPF